jgi:hypothetical protein
MDLRTNKFLNKPGVYNMRFSRIQGLPAITLFKGVLQEISRKASHILRLQKIGEGVNNLFSPAHLEMVCPSCLRPHKNDWKPQFWRHTHYKTRTCDCGYKVFIRTEIFHSGHY